ncbi:MAG: 5-oxoprolinase subunit PxpB, partial [Lachnospiraceae bacterium]|nr:5-oxoprolinase subunit PxpB [Lachnospiraceae bacterium]
EYGPDLDYVAEYHQMSKEEVIKLHTEAEYLIYMLGFTPGFSYMGGMDERIATPRLKTPRVLIPAGSVGIAGGQTGIYPIDSPGGWQLIGRTPVRMYDAERQTPILLDAGLHVRFVPIIRQSLSSLIMNSLRAI